MHACSEFRRGDPERMRLLQASLVVMAAGVVLYTLLWKLGGIWVFPGIIAAAMIVFAAYYWFALRD